MLFTTVITVVKSFRWGFPVRAAALSGYGKCHPTVFNTNALQPFHHQSTKNSAPSSNKMLPYTHSRLAASTFNTGTAVPGVPNQNLDDETADDANLTDLDDDLDDNDESDDTEEDEGLVGPKEGSLRLKVRQHVNPLASTYQKPIEMDANWVASAFANPKQPTVVDIGCAKGTWVLKSGLQTPGRNFLGLEIRRPVVNFALQRKGRWGLSNVHFVSTNANIDLNRLLTDLKREGASLDMICIQFPDPHFKNKHKKRRVVNALLVDTIVGHLDAGKLVFVQSDVLDVLEDMVMNFSNHESLEMVEGYDPLHFDRNPSPNPVLTEREIATFNKGLPVYRMLFRKKSTPV